MSTPLTDAVDNASYPDPAAHREALRGLCRRLEEAASESERRVYEAQHAGAIHYDRAERAEARVVETERQRRASELANMGLRAKVADREARLRAVTEALALAHAILAKLDPDTVARAANRAAIKHEDGNPMGFIASVLDAARSADLPSAEKLIGLGWTEATYKAMFADLPSLAPWKDAPDLLAEAKRVYESKPADLPPHPDTSIGELVCAVRTFLKDWRDGDFTLPRLAEIHAEQLTDKLARAQAGKEGS